MAKPAILITVGTPFSDLFGAFHSMRKESLENIPVFGGPTPLLNELCAENSKGEGSGPIAGTGLKSS